MILLDDIIEAYYSARSNKRKSPDQVEFELHLERNCLKLYNDIINHSVEPTAYTFVKDEPRPREVFASDFSTRILHHYIDLRIRHLLERRLSMHTFNNRVGMGQNACQNAVIGDIYSVSRCFTQDAWIVKVDLQGCFPNINQDIAYKMLEEVVLNDYEGYDKNEVLYMLRLCIYSYPTSHCFRKSPLSKWKLIDSKKSLFSKPLGVGAAIGHLIWQNAVNYYFHEFDEWILSMDVKYERFVDDMYFVVDNKDFLLLIPEMRCRLAKIGATIHPDKFYCQHYTKGCECLGVHIKLDRVYANNRIIRRAKHKARSFNRCIREGKIDKIISSMNSYLGICKNLNGYGKAYEIVNCLSRKWSKYIEYNKERMCIVAKNGYKHRQRIVKHFNLLDYGKYRRKATRLRSRDERGLPCFRHSENQGVGK